MTSPVRSASVSRATGETDIALALTLDGSGKTDVKTGFGMLDHMTTLMAFWASFDLSLRCEGDLHIDAHHCVEDVGLCLGSALLEALGDKKGILRVGSGSVPMDEALTTVHLDLSGRPWLVWRGFEQVPPVIAREEKDLWREFYKALSSAGKFNLHIDFLYGQNGHHMLESAAKSAGVALGQAVARKGFQLRSTKGELD